MWLIILPLPPVMLVAASMNCTALFRSPMDLLLFRDFMLENFTRAFTRGDFRFFFTNAVIISTSAVVITPVVCVPLAYPKLALERFGMGRVDVMKVFPACQSGAMARRIQRFSRFLSVVNQWQSSFYPICLGIFD